MRTPSLFFLDEAAKLDIATDALYACCAEFTEAADFNQGELAVDAAKALRKAVRRFLSVADPDFGSK